MFKNLNDYREERAELIAQSEAIIENAKQEDRELLADEQAQIDDIIENKLPANQANIDRSENINRLKNESAKARIASGDIVVPGGNKEQDAPFANVRVPTSVAIPANRKGFKNDAKGGYVSGLWVAALVGNRWAKNKLADVAPQFANAMSEGSNSAGGFLVPDPLANEIIRLVENAGVFRQNARVVPMSSDSLAVPRRTGGLTVYYPGEGSSISASDLTFAQASISAVKYATISLMSTELNEDSVIGMSALLAEEIAYGIAVAEDTNGFIGDGTSTYGSITGVASALAAGSKVQAASGKDTVAELALADYHAAQGAQLQVPGANNKWYCHSSVYYNSLAPLMTAAGGNTAADLAAGTVPRFLGSEVVFTQVLPDSDAAADSLVAYYGDLSLAATMGSRRDVSVKILNELFSASDQIGIQATSRSGITVHEVGSGSAGGPLIGVQLAAS